MLAKLIAISYGILLAFPSWAQYEVGTGTEAPPLSPDTIMPAGKIEIDRDTIPPPRSAFSTERLHITCTGPYGTTCTGSGKVPARFDTSDGVVLNGGQFRINCSFSHSAFDDPIVWPGQSGRTHLHIFFGNDSTRSSTDLTNMATSGNSTCHGGTVNRSGYWVPALIYECRDPADLAAHICDPNRNGEVQYPNAEANFYYKSNATYNDHSPSSDSGSYGGAPLQWPAPGFRMIGGCTVAADCTAPQTSVFRHFCVRGGADIAQYDHIPTQAEATGVGGCDELKILAGFPRCWDGINIDSPTHKAHINAAPYTDAHISDATGNTNVGCTDSHYPIIIPGISTNIHYDITSLVDLDYFRLSSDLPKAEAKVHPSGNCLAANNWCAGRTNHADWVNGWKNTNIIGLTGGDWGMTITDAILKGCYMILNNPATPVGSDCHNHLLASPLDDDNWWAVY